MTTIAWSEGLLAGEIARQTLAKRCVVLVDRCNWTGHECDVLGVTTDLRIIDVEIKISRSDLRADARKDKWWHRVASGYETVAKPWGQQHQVVYTTTPRQWPPRVWKHYYCMPASVWDDSLFDALPARESGVLVVANSPGESLAVRCVRRATPNRNAARLKPEQVMDIARLANLRMWDAYRRAAQEADVAEYWREKARAAGVSA